MPLTIYHNPRCSKSRATLDLVRAAGVTHPRCIERPIVVDEARRLAVIGRPPENVRALLP